MDAVESPKNGTFCGYPANAPQFFAKFSAPRSDSAKIV
jgi:hypothetical protein